MAVTTRDVVISADAHVGEPEAMRRRLPKRYRDRLPEFGVDDKGHLEFLVKGKRRRTKRDLDPVTAEDLLREFRTDPSQGTDLDRRLHDMALEGVDAQVIYPNVGLACSLGNEPAGYYHAWARAHNDHVWELFGPHRQRFKPAALLAVDDARAMVAEAERCLRLGFETLFLPANVPWQPYRLPIYDRLWRLAAEACVPISFHIFSGNAGLGSDFAFVGHVSADRAARARALAAREAKTGVKEMTGITSLGVASGMAPIAELAGAGVLARHPDLRFVVVECECGWLAWLLQILDQMQEKRYHNMLRLDLKPSEYFFRQGAVTITDDPVALNNVAFTGTDCLMWGNDYPHDEGTFPTSRRQIDAIRRALGPKRAHDVLARNAARAYGFDPAWLAANRAEVTRHAA